MSELQLVTDESLQAALGVSRSTLWRLRQQGLPIRRVGRSIRYPLDEVQAWLGAQPDLIRETSAKYESRQAGRPAERQMSIFDATRPTLDNDEGGDYSSPLSELPPCHWSQSVALDPKHRPQVPEAPSNTARKDWRKYPQEAHLLDPSSQRYRRLTEDEIAVIQGFPSDWGKGLGLTHRERIAGLGNAVPPPVGEALFRALRDVLEEPPRTAVEICAGFGGLALGAHRADGIKVLGLVEIWEAAVRVLRAAGHWDPVGVHLGDVKTFDWASLRGTVDVLSGGPPCQPWSVAGLSKGAEDERDLLGEMPSLVEVLQPRAFLFENVPGLLSPTHKSYLEWLVEELRLTGTYGVAVGVVQAADFGVPQKRKRVIIAGIRGRSDGVVHDFFDKLYERRTHADPARAIPRGRQPWVTLDAALPGWKQVGGWRRWLDGGSTETVSGSIRTGNRQTPNPGTKENQADDRRIPAIGLVWPGRDKAVFWNGSHWSISREKDTIALEVNPLIPEREKGRPLLDPWYVTGDHVKALESLRAALGRRAKLVYYEPSRLDTDLVSFAAEDAKSRLDTWLTLNQASIRRALSLVRDDGVMAILTGVAEQPYLQVLLDEMFGPENRVGTIVWQKGYSVQGQKKDKPKKEIYPTHDYVLVYSRRREECLPGAALKGPPQNFSNEDGDPRGPWKAEQKGANYHRPSSDFSVNLPPYRWEMVGGDPPPWFWRVSPKSGVIWAPREEIKEPGEWTIKVRVSDSAGKSAEVDFTLRVVEQGTPPKPQVPSWLIARDEKGNPTNDASPANAPRPGGAIRILTRTLPVGVVGKPYYACIEAKGGKPFVGTTRPGKDSKTGKSRYWDLSYTSLEEAAAEDKIDFKAKDDSIPAIKVHLDGASFTYLNQISTWRGGGKAGTKEEDLSRVGWGQDAKKELEALLASGVVKKVINISKPAGLMTRLMALFTDEEDFVIDIGSPAAEMAALSCQMRRRVIYVEMPGTEEDAKPIRVPRLRTAARGRHPLPDGVLFWGTSGEAPAEGYYVGRRPRDVQPTADVCLFQLGAPLLKIDASTHVPTVDYQSYPSGSIPFAQALASSEGLVWFPGGEGEFARSHDGRMIALHLPGEIVLDGRFLEKLKGKYSQFLSEVENKVRVYYHRGYGDFETARSGSFELRLVPFELVLTAGGWL